MKVYLYNYSNWVEPSKSIDVVHGISIQIGYKRMLAVCREIFQLDVMHFVRQSAQHHSVSKQTSHDL